MRLSWTSRHWSSKNWTILIAVVVVAAGYFLTSFALKGNSKDDATVTQQSTNNVTPANTQTNPPTTDPNAPPEWRTTFNSLIALQNAALQKPDPAAVDQFISPTCTCYVDTKTNLQQLVDNGWHVQGNYLDARAVALISDTGTKRQISVGFNATGAPTVDASGKVMQAGQTGYLQPVLYVLQQDGDGNWLITDRQVYGERQK